MPMLLALNYSSEAAALLSSGQIRIDRFKCPDWPGLVAEARGYSPVAVHFGIKAGSSKLYNKDWDQVARLLEETETPYVNLHLDPEAKHFPGIPVDTGKPHHWQIVADRLLEDVEAVVARFGAERVIAENVPYHGLDGKVLRPGVEPEVIRRIIQTTGCGLLLDISHARIAAHNLGMDEREYMEALPVDRLRELHFTGLHNLNGRLTDHLEILESDWPSLEWVLERIRSGAWARPWMLAYEYGGVGEGFAWRSSPEVIASQVPLLDRLVKG